MIVPTARAARGRPATRARSPYVATRPGGMRRSAASTRRANGENLAAGDRIVPTLSVSRRPGADRGHAEVVRGAAGREPEWGDIRRQPAGSVRELQQGVRDETRGRESQGLGWLAIENEAGKDDRRDAQGHVEMCQRD